MGLQFLYNNLQAQNITFHIKSHISGPTKWWKSISTYRQTPEILVIFSLKLIKPIFNWKSYFPKVATCFWHSYNVLGIYSEIVL